MALLAVGLYPADLPAKQDPTFIDTVFDNRGVVWMARLLLVSAAAVLAFGGVFIVLSTAIRMKNGEWLRRAGPFEVSEVGARELEDLAEFWRRRAISAQGETGTVAKCLQESDGLLGRLHDD